MLILEDSILEKYIERFIETVQACVACQGEAITAIPRHSRRLNENFCGFWIGCREGDTKETWEKRNEKQAGERWNMRGTKTVITFHLELLNSKISHQRAGALNNSDNISYTFYLLGTTATYYGKHYIVKIATTIAKCNRSYSNQLHLFLSLFTLPYRCNHDLPWTAKHVQEQDEWVKKRRSSLAVHLNICQPIMTAILGGVLAWSCLEAKRTTPTAWVYKKISRAVIGSQCTNEDATEVNVLKGSHRVSQHPATEPTFQRGERHLPCWPRPALAGRLLWPMWTWGLVGSVVSSTRPHEAGGSRPRSHQTRRCAGCCYSPHSSSCRSTMRRPTPAQVGQQTHTHTLQSLKSSYMIKMVSLSVNYFDIHASFISKIPTWRRTLLFVQLKKLNQECMYT